ncbi:MAG TPA: two-component regulator propeller domain-containing protein [Roseateles sp.]
MTLSFTRLDLAYRTLLVWLAAMCFGSCQAAVIPGDGWSAYGDTVFRPADGTAMVVNAFAQDRRGLLWIASQTSLSSWDGYKLRTLSADPTTVGALPDSLVRSLLVDKNGRLWVGTGSAGLAAYDEASGRFDVPVPAGNLSHKDVLGIAQDRDGLLLLATRAGLDRLDPVRRVVQRHAEWAAALGLPASVIHAVLLDRSGSLWVGSPHGLYRRDDRGRFVQVPLGALSAEEGDVGYLMEDSDGRMWVGTMAYGAFTVEKGATVAQPLHERIANAQPRMAFAQVFAIEEATPGEVWLGTQGQGIFRVDTRRWQARYVRHIEGAAASLPLDNIGALFRDRQGLMWVATDANVSLHDPQEMGVTTWFSGRDSILTSEGVPFVLSMPDGTVWLSRNAGGIDVISPQGGRLGSVLPDARKPEHALPEGRVVSMVASPDGRQVYAGTRRGVYRIEVATLKARRLMLAGRSSTADTWATAVQGDRLWVGGSDGVWALQLPAHAGKGQPGNASDDAALAVIEHYDGEGLGNVPIACMHAGRDGGLWVGTFAGLVRLDPATRRVQQFPRDAPGKLGLPVGIISSVQTDAQGRVWVSSYGAGIRVFELTPHGPKNLRRVSTAEGLPSNAVNGLAVDRRGDVWASTDDGIVRISHDTLMVQPIGRTEGLGVQVYWIASAAVTSTGHVLFGGNGGLTIIEPELGIGTRTAPPPIVVDEIQLGDSPPLTGYTLTGGAKPLVVPSDRRNLKVAFAGLHYAAPTAVRYQYRLQGVDPAWVSTEASRRFAAYTNLPPGDHVLELRAAAPGGSWSDPLQIPLRVQAAWHETVWARTALVMAGLAMAGLMVRLRTRLLERRAAALGALVAERTEELEQRTKQLEASREALRDLGAHNARSLEDERKRVARELHDEFGQQLAALKMEVSVLRMNGTTGAAPSPQQWDELRGRVEQMVVCMRRLVANLRPVALDAGVDAALEWLAAEFTRDTGVSCEAKLGPGCRTLPPEVAIVVFRIAQEALDNVRRHANSRHVSMTLLPRGEDWQLSVIDDGIGFDSTRRRSGYGLLGMEERAGLAGGSLQINSAPGKGTQVLLTIRARALPTSGAQPLTTA